MDRRWGGVNFFESFENVSFNGDFVGNHALYGGAIAIKNGKIENVSFIGNLAEISGGAIYFDSNGTITNCNFTNNKALLMGGSVYFNETGTVNKSSFKNNNAYEGGAIYSCGNLEINNSQFKGNTATLKTNHISLKENATIKLKNVSPEKIGPISVSDNIKVAASNKAYVINYGGKYSVTVKDIKNNLVSGAKVTFILNGKTIGKATTKSKGVATITLTAKMLKTAKAGKRNLVIKASNSNYYTVSKTVKITISKEKTKITAKAKKFKKSLKTKKYTVTLKNSKGKPVKKVSVSLKVKGKTYYAKTSSKGKATFKIKKLTKKGKFNASVTYKGSKYYAKATKKVRITII